MSNFSNATPTANLTSTFQKHHSYEVSTSLTESKTIADNYAEANRYQHRAKVMVVGNATLRPYDPIYLDGLPNGMSGYWTVLSIEHVFNGKLTGYVMHLEVGTDIIGDTDPNAAINSQTRDVQSDLAGQSLTSSGSQLTQYTVSPNANSLYPVTSASDTTAVVAPSAKKIPTIAGITSFKDNVPNVKNVKNNVQWTSKSNGKVLK